MVGVRVLDDGSWYGEGEVKIYRDGDRELPTICGTGLEDYVGSAWGMGAHHGPYAGRRSSSSGRATQGGESPPPASLPAFVGFYRWHVVDPIVFTDELRVTIQQIGMHTFPAGAVSSSRPSRSRTRRRAPAGGAASRASRRSGSTSGSTTTARPRSSTHKPQPVDRLDVDAARADLGRLAHERPDPMEAWFT